MAREQVAKGGSTGSDRVATWNEQQAQRRTKGAAARVWAELRRNRLAGIGVVFLAVIVLLAIFAPFVTEYEPQQQNLLARLNSPTSAHWLGTDDKGRDVLTRMVYGARVSLFVGIVGTAGGVLAGALLGMLSGYFGGWIDQLVMRLMDIMLAFPGILLAMLIIAVLGPSMWNLIFAIAIWGTPALARIVRGTVLSLREQEFIEAAHAIGASSYRVMLMHLLPNSSAPIIVYTTLGVAAAILTAAALGFLGLGVPPPMPEWGMMLSEGRQYLRTAPHLVMFPGITIFLTLLALNFIGDALRDALDPYITD
jgi:peptide/nickel transport system permease protein